MSPAKCRPICLDLNGNGKNAIYMLRIVNNVIDHKSICSPKSIGVADGLMPIWHRGV